MPEPDFRPATLELEVGHVHLGERWTLALALFYSAGLTSDVQAARQTGLEQVDVSGSGSTLASQLTCIVSILLVTTCSWTWFQRC